MLDRLFYALLVLLLVPLAGILGHSALLSLEPAPAWPFLGTPAVVRLAGPGEQRPFRLSGGTYRVTLRLEGDGTQPCRVTLRSTDGRLSSVVVERRFRGWWRNNRELVDVRPGLFLFDVTDCGAWQIGLSEPLGQLPPGHRPLAL